MLKNNLSVKISLIDFWLHKLPPLGKLCRSIVSRLCHRLAGKLLITSLCFVPTFVSALPLFTVHASAHLWEPDLGGSIGQTTNAFDFSSEFGESEGTGNSLLVALEHPVPLIPNFQLRQTPLTWQGMSESASGTLLGTVTVSGELDAELELDLLDGTVYYEILDNWVTLDLGVTARQLSGFFAARDISGLSDRVEVEQIIPMGYAHARFDLPFTGLAAGLRGNGIAVQDNNLLDLEAYLHLEIDLLPLVDVGVQGGLRRMTLQIDDIDNWNSDATLDGAYIGLTAQF